MIISLLSISLRTQASTGDQNILKLIIIILGSVLVSELLKFATLQQSFNLQIYSQSLSHGVHSLSFAPNMVLAFYQSQVWGGGESDISLFHKTEEKQKGSMGLCMGHEYQIGQRSVETKSPRRMAPKEGVSVLTLGQSCTVQGRKNTAREVVLQNKFLTLQECI